jgi:hypothetical protein
MGSTIDLCEIHKFNDSFVKRYKKNIDKILKLIIFIKKRERERGMHCVYKDQKANPRRTIHIQDVKANVVILVNDFEGVLGIFMGIFRNRQRDFDKAQMLTI